MRHLLTLRYVLPHANPCCQPLPTLANPLDFLDFQHFYFLHLCDIEKTSVFVSQILNTAEAFRKQYLNI
jgi:hypothetical protein